jgi:hypothetical protein
MGAGFTKGLEAYTAGKKDIRDLERDIMTAESAVRAAQYNQNWKEYEQAMAKLTTLTNLYHNAAQISVQEQQVQAMLANAAANRDATASWREQQGALKLLEEVTAALAANPGDKNLRDKQRQVLQKLGLQPLEPAPAGSVRERTQP